ncbi:MDR family MFS transporter [Brevibacillus daliensis]|uniref:MDR family MFS transporter n=1 Tax=Brevibacillus daliensis TaxID=2892995 RepID=UPI001E2EE41A|nr:MFS transporter [Brevibacillus daliensis]
MHRLREFIREYHPIVHTLIIGTVFVRAASSMSMPFLAIYLSNTTNLSPVMIGLIIGAGPLASTVGGFVGGTLSDQFGRRRIMLIALYTWVFVFLGFAIGKSALFFILLNILAGLCRSFYEPVSQALMADISEPEKRFKVFSLRYLAINVGVAVGPLLGAWLALWGGAFPFFVTAAIYLLYTIILQGLLTRFGIKDIEGQKKEQVNFTLAFQVVKQDVALRYYIMGGILVAFGYSQMTTTLPQYVNQTLVDGVVLYSYLLSLNAITVVILQMPISKWAENKTPLYNLIVGCLLYAIGLIGFGVTSSFVGLLIAMFIFTLGEIITFPASTVFIDNLAPEGMRGTYFGAQSFHNLGQSIGPAFAGYILGLFNGTVMFIVVAIISLASILFYMAGERDYSKKTGKKMGAMSAEENT